MSSFTEPLTVTKIGGRLWRVEKSFTYFVGSENSTDFVTVPKGFETDFASVPRGFWNLIPPDGEYSQSAVLHDYILNKKIYPVKKCDQVFLESMVVLKVPAWKRNLMFFAVRCWHLWK